MIQWLMRTWRRRQRKIDVDILWPICKREAEADMWRTEHPQLTALDCAKGAFMVHCALDSAWTADFSEAEIAAMVDELE
jgi:hypothetical protein